MTAKQMERLECGWCDEWFERAKGSIRACCSRQCSSLYGRKRTLERTGRAHLVKKLHLRTPQEAAYSKYKGGARRKGRRFSVTFNEFIKLWGKPCTYCGDPIETIGVDRIDSSLGYVKRNIQPCCKKCNWAKRNFPGIVFIEHCVRVATHQREISLLDT